MRNLTAMRHNYSTPVLRVEGTLAGQTLAVAPGLQTDFSLNVLDTINLTTKGHGLLEGIFGEGAGIDINIPNGAPGGGTILALHMS